MTTDEIKQNISMPELMRRYGVEVKRNMCKCPFHQDHSPSMKVYKDGCHCFTCGKSWDVFSFVMEMDNCDFKTAFKTLGGQYDTFQSNTDKILSERKFKAKKASAEKVEQDKKKLTTMLIASINILDAVIELYEPYSDEWCEAKKYYPLMEWYLDQFTKGKDIDTQDVIRRYRKLNDRFLVIR